MKFRNIMAIIEARRSPPSRGAWIEIRVKEALRMPQMSPPSRGAWIEILMFCLPYHTSAVAPLAGGVD